MRITRWWVLAAIGLAGCSSNVTTTPTPITPSTFVMTWPTLAFPAVGLGSTAPVPVASVSDSNAGEFPFTTTCSVGGSLGPGSTCTVTAQFTPTALGARTATLTIGANSATQTFDLTGAGVAPVKPQLMIDLATGPPSTIFTLTVTGATTGGSLTLHTVQ